MTDIASENAPVGTKQTTDGGHLNLVVVGHVDHGKSTVVGRLLADTDSLPEGKLEQVRAKCEATGKRFEYAFLLDALADEQSQGITIDAARIFFKTEFRRYIIIDAPGHIEFLKNMVTGASHADAALLVIDAAEGVQENSRRHGYMLSLLGVKDVVVLVNKMDSVGYDQKAFTAIVNEYRGYLDSIGVEPRGFIPVSGLEGDTIASRSEHMEWYDGDTVLQALDKLVPAVSESSDTLRMYVQDVYKFTRFGDTRRIVAGTLISGSLQAGDKVVFYPSGKVSEVESIELFARDGVEQVSGGEAVGFTLKEQIYVRRGELVTLADQARPNITTRIRVSLFWLGTEPMLRNREYEFKVGTAKVRAHIEEIRKVIDAGSLDASESGTEIARNAVAECVLKVNTAIAFDEVEVQPESGRFVLVDDYRIVGGGIIREGLPDAQSSVRETAMRRNAKWIHSLISPRERAAKYSQRSMLLLVTGQPDADRKLLGKTLESNLFDEGKIVYFLGIGSIVYGLDSDLQGKEDIEHEHIRRLAEVANIMLDAGMIFVVSASSLTQADLELAWELVGKENIRTIWMGEEITSDIRYDLHLPDADDIETSVEQAKELLYSNQIIFRPW